MNDLLRAEIRKLRFTRSLWAIPLAGIAIAAVGSIVMITAEESEIAETLSAHGPLRFGPTNFGLLALLLAIRLFGDEVHHHTLASTLLGSPNRRRVVTAKAIVAIAVALVMTVAIAAIVVPVTVIGASARDLRMVIDYGTTLELLGRTAIAMALFALLGVGLAVAVRNRTIAIVGALVWVTLGEDRVGSLLHLGHRLPVAAFRGIVEGDASPTMPDPVSSGVALAAFAVGALVLASFALRRDV